MKNWKTTLFGALAALGAYFTNQSDPKIQFIGQLLTPIATAFLGYFAQDHGTPKS